MFNIFGFVWLESTSILFLSKENSNTFQIWLKVWQDDKFHFSILSRQFGAMTPFLEKYFSTHLPPLFLEIMANQTVDFTQWNALILTVALYTYMFIIFAFGCMSINLC